MTVDELQEQMDAIVAKADAESRSLSDDEVQNYEGLEKDLLAARKTSEVRSRHAAYKAPILATSTETATKDVDDLQERAFDTYLRTGQRSSALIENRAQGEGSPTAGGYLVPDGFRQKLVERRVRFGGLMNVVENITTDSGETIRWPTIDDTANAGEIVAEHATGAAGADLVFGTASLGAYKYMSLGASNLPLRVSVELLQDSAFDIQSLVGRLMGDRIARAMAADFATGDGSGEPLGILTGTADIELATSNPVTYQKLLDTVHAIDPEYRPNARWVMNDSTAAVLQGLLDQNDRPLWLASNAGLADRPAEDRLLGYPVTIDQSFPDIANDTNFAVFGDLQEAYVVRHVKGVTLVVDPYGRAANGEVQFTAWARADGTIQNRNAYAILAGFNA